MADGVANAITCIRDVAQTLLGADHLHKEYNTYAQGYPDGPPPLGPAAWICSKSAQHLASLTSLCDEVDRKIVTRWECFQRVCVHVSIVSLPMELIMCLCTLRCGYDAPSSAPTAPEPSSCPRRGSCRSSCL